MANAYIGYAKKDGTIKSVKVIEDGDIDKLGVTLVEYFGNYTDVKDTIKSTIISFNEDEVEYVNESDDMSLEDDNEYYIYDTLEDFVEDMNSSSFYYLFANNMWYVSKPDESKLHDLEQVIEEEY